MRGGIDSGLPQLYPPSSLHRLTPTLYSTLWLQDGASAYSHKEPATFVKVFVLCKKYKFIIYSSHSFCLLMLTTHDTCWYIANF